MTVAEQIEDYIKDTGEITSLNAMLETLGITYSWGWTCILMLENAGKIIVNRGGRGVALTITHVSHAHPQPSTPNAETLPDAPCPTNGE